MFFQFFFFNLFKLNFDFSRFDFHQLSAFPLLKGRQTPLSDRKSVKVCFFEFISLFQLSVGNVNFL